MNKTLLILLKIALGVVLLYVIYHTITSELGSIDLSEIKIVSLNSNVFLLLIVLLMMPVNLSLESFKWSYVLNRQGVSMPFLKSMYSTLLGLAMSLLTPFKVGDYIGRMLLIRSSEKKYSFYATLLSSLSQNLVNVVIGLFGVYFLLNHTHFIDKASFIIPLGIFSFCVAFIFITYIDQILEIFQNFKFIKSKFQKWSFKRTTTQNKGVIVFVSILRYMTYLLQYILILKFFDVDLSIIGFVSGVSTIFLIQSCLPLPPFLNFLARSEIAMLVWNLYSVDVVIALLASIVLWGINIAIPALIGMIIGVRFVN